MSGICFLRGDTILTQMYIHRVSLSSLSSPPVFFFLFKIGQIVPWIIAKAPNFNNRAKKSKIEKVLTDVTKIAAFKCIVKEQNGWSKMQYFHAQVQAFAETRVSQPRFDNFAKFSPFKVLPSSCPLLTPDSDNPKAEQWTNILENVRLKQVFDEEKVLQISNNQEVFLDSLPFMRSLFMCSFRSLLFPSLS